MKTYSRRQLEERRRLYPKADYTNFEQFLKTVNIEDLTEMIELFKKNIPEMDDFLCHVFGLIFMNEYGVDEYRQEDFYSLRNQMLRQCVAEFCERFGKYDTSVEDKRLVIDDRPF